MTALTVLAVWVAGAVVVGVGLGKGLRGRDERAGNTRAKQDADQAAQLDARAAARHSHGSHHLAVRRRGVDLRPVPPAPWVER